MQQNAEGRKKSLKYKAYNTFDEIKNYKLRAFNRMVTAKNIAKDAGKAIAEQYLKQFSEQHKKEISAVMWAVKINGIESVRKEVAHG